LAGGYQVIERLLPGIGSPPARSRAICSMTSAGIRWGATKPNSRAGCEASS
jgi:hypothetical protein